MTNEMVKVAAEVATDEQVIETVAKATSKIGRAGKYGIIGLGIAGCGTAGVLAWNFLIKPVGRLISGGLKGKSAAEEPVEYVPTDMDTDLGSEGELENK